MDYKLFYGENADITQTEARFKALEEKHLDLFKTKPEAFYSTSGRTELGGNHTDHNLGNVLAGSINLDTIAAVHETNDYTVTLLSEGYSPVTVDISNLDPVPEEDGTTRALVRGIAASIVKRGGFVGGWCANTTSNVLRGSGLSSSAAVEVLIGTIFNDLFNNNRFSTTEIAIMGQEAENNYFKKPCGLMDQIACANGGIVGIDFKTPGKPVIESVKTDFTSYGYSLIVVNTGGNHSDLTPDYAAIPPEMKSVASFFGKTYMREVSEQEFFDNLAEIRKATGNDRAILRAYHFLKETQRAKNMIDALKKGNFSEYLNLVNESGTSSFKYVQNIYSPHAVKEQGISLALALSENFLNGKGACRVQGGGFAGTIQAYIPLDMKDDYCKYMEKVFNIGCCIELLIRNVPTGRIK